MSNCHGRVRAVAVSRRKGIPKTLVPSVTLREEWGIENDVHAGTWHRQVSLLAMESIDTMRRRGLAVRPGAFAENITTEGLVLHELVPGDMLEIGGTRLEITQIGKECHTLCAIAIRAGDCVMPREGIFARVLRGGDIRPGDAIVVTPKAGPREADARPPDTLASVADARDAHATEVRVCAAASMTEADDDAAQGTDPFTAERMPHVAHPWDVIV